MSTIYRLLIAKAHFIVDHQFTMGILMRLCLTVHATLQLSLAIQMDVFSTKTSYFWSHNISQEIDSGESVTFENLVCKAIHVNLIARHGARNPSTSNIKEIDQLHTKITAHKDSMKHPELNHWTNRYDVTMATELVPMGAREQEQLGKDYGRVFHGLLSNNSQGWQFLTSRKQRTIDSARSFHNGLVSQLGIQTPFVSHVNDSLMRFYDGCARYEKSVIDNTTNFKQFEDFSKTPAFLNVSSSVRRRLGLNVTLTPEDVYIIYNLCAYETYIFNDTRWCAVMTDYERGVLEYGMDVQNYYESMYGNPLNSRVACPLIRDIFYTIDKVIGAWNDTGSEPTGYLAGKFQFGHSETVGKMLNSLGLFRDQADFLATNMVAMENRKFRSSLVLPYSANVAFVLYRCEAGSMTGTPTFYLRLLVNEQILAFPICGGKEMCPYETVRQAYANSVDNCDEKIFCSLKTETIVG